MRVNKSKSRLRIINKAGGGGDSFLRRCLNGERMKLSFSGLQSMFDFIYLYAVDEVLFLLGVAAMRVREKRVAHNELLKFKW